MGATAAWLSDLFNPKDPERVRILAERWGSFPEAQKGTGQAIGRYVVGCGATHGIHERCDFGCTACYLGVNANRQPAMPFAAVKRQLEAQRAYLGPGGNLQITSGEVTLLPLQELTRIVRTAVDLGLSPMVMTHGDVLLHQPDYLDHLVVKGGLRKLSFHVDSTQRGRKGMGKPLSEAQLHPVRDRIAELLSACRRRTGVKLKAATTLTVNRQNLAEMGSVLTWFLENLDSLRILSCQPQALTGRTRSDNGVSAAEVWHEFEKTLGTAINPHAFSFGHHACNRIALFAALTTTHAPILLQAVEPDHPEDRRLIDRFLEDFSGVVFNGCSTARVVRRIIGVVLRKPVWLPRLGWYGLKRLWRERRHLGPALWSLCCGRLRVRLFALATHSFMDRELLATAEGQQRLAACVFKVPLNGEMVSMCQMNATGLRDASYGADAQSV